MSQRLPEVVFARPTDRGLELRCRECHAETTIALPVPIVEMAAFTRAFVRLHRPCAKRAAQ